MRKLIVDGQLFQTAAWHRGMGKYSVELLTALDTVQSGTWDAVDIILSKNIDTEDEVVPMLTARVPGAEVVMLDLLADEIGNSKIPEHNRRVVDEYIVDQGEQVEIDFFILSAMQGVIYPTFPSVSGVRKLLLFYDIIPFMFHDVYLRNGITRGEYLPRIGELLRADMCLAISETVANDLALYLGIDKSRIVNIDGGAIKHSDEQKEVRMAKPFILMPTGNDLRKNNRRAILGFDAFNKRSGNKYSLVITSFFKEHEIAELSALSDNVVFTGNVGGAELNYLYEHATALLFPPEYEGLGMPILEALEKRKPVACSNISVFREMSHQAFHYFDPYSVLEISSALLKTVDQQAIDEKEYERILAKYTWENSARAVIEMVSQPMKLEPGEKGSIAVFGPDPAHQSSAGKVMQENNAELSRQFDITYFVEPAVGESERRPSYLPFVTLTQEIAPGISYDPSRYVTPVYHIGNGEEFAYITFMALGNPGVIVLHDTDLTKTWQGMLRLGLIDATRFDIEKRIQKQAANTGTVYAASLIAQQRAVLVFSESSEAMLKKLATLCNSSVRVYASSLPVPGIMYKNALPLKTVGSLDISNSLNDVAATDYRVNTSVSKCKKVTFKTAVSEQQVLEAMRFGADIEVSDRKQYDIPPRGARTTITTVVDEHSEREFIEKLTAAINETVIQERN